MTDPLDINSQNPDIQLQEKTIGKNILHAPQPALPVADESTINTGSGVGTYVSGSAAATITNMRSRIDALETALIKLGLIKHN
jgi:hypothetical protein